MKKCFYALCAFAFLTGMSVIADDEKDKAKDKSKEQVTDTKTTTASGTTKTHQDTVYGKVEEYTPGKSIKVSVPGKIIDTKTFDLADKDVMSHVASNIKVGDWVSVMEKTDKNGKKHLQVQHSKQNAARETQ